MKEITRRNFLKKSVAVTVAAGMLPVLGNAGELMMSGEGARCKRPWTEAGLRCPRETYPAYKLRRNMPRGLS